MQKLLLLSAVLFSQALFAQSKYACVDTAVSKAVMHNYRQVIASTTSCGVKALATGQLSEIYSVCTSDENGVAEYAVVIRKDGINPLNGKKEACAVQQIELLNVGFDNVSLIKSEEGLIKGAQGCSINDGDVKGMICQK